jgi:hypothetical protein
MLSSYDCWAEALTAVMKWASWTKLAMISARDQLFLRSESSFGSANIKPSIRFDAGLFDPSDLFELRSSLDRVVAVQARPTDARAVALAAHKEGLVTVGYAWLWLEPPEPFELSYVENDEVTNRPRDSSDDLQSAGQTEELLHALQGWLFITPMNRVSQSFLDRVGAVANRGLGNQSVESVQEGWSGAPGAHTVDLLAANLYDSIMLYARTAGQVLRAKQSLSNGPAVVAAMKNITFQGATGFVRLDATGSRLDAIQVVNIVISAAGALERTPVGVYDASSQQYTPEAGRAVVWPGGATTVPVDSLPSCGVGQYIFGGRCDDCGRGTYSAGYTATTCAPCAPGVVISFASVSVVACMQHRRLLRSARSC